MANTFLTPDVIAPKALEKFRNALNLVGFIDRQLDDTFEGKVGDTIRVKRLTRYKAVSGADVTGQLQDTIEGSVSVVLDTYKSVPVPITSTELTLDLESFSEQIVEPAMIELAQQVETDIAGLYKDVWHQVGTPGTTPSTIADAMLTKTKMNLYGVPNDNKRASFYEPNAASAMAAVLGGVFPTNLAELAIEEGMIRRYAGFVYMENQSIVNHTVGAYGGTPLINGAGQNVTYDSVKGTYEQSLITDGWTATTSVLERGDRFTIADVYGVNPKTRQSTGQLQQFVVKEQATADGSGNKTLAISPPIITSGAFQTVDAAPADGAPITVVSGTAGTQYPQNLALHKNAFTLAMANLALPMGGADGARESAEGISVRVVMDFDVLTNTNIMRFDILYTTVAQNAGMAVVHVG